MAALLLGSGACASPVQPADSSGGDGAGEPNSSIRPPWSLAQFEHRAYVARDGAPLAATVIAQTADGFLWLGSENGLTRFDGIRFDATIGASLPAHDISTLYADTNGDLWVGYLWGGFSVLHDGKFTSTSAEYSVKGTVLDFLRSSPKTVWMATTGGLARFQDGHASLIGKADGYDGTRPIWLGEAEGRFYFLVQDQAFEIDPRSDALRPADFEAIAQIAQRTAHRTAAGDLASHVTSRLRDTFGAVWMVQEGVPGIARNRGGDGDPSPVVEEHFDHRDGLSGLNAITVFQDRESNVWVSTEAGIDRFSMPKFTPAPVLNNNDILALTPDHAGGVVVTAVTQGAVRLKGDDSPQIIPTFGYSFCLSTDRQGSLWTKQGNDLVALAGSAIHRIPLPTELIAKDPTGQPFSPRCQSMAEDLEGNIWLSLAQGGMGVLRWSKGAWALNGGVTGLPVEPAIRLHADDAGRVWMGYKNNRIALVDGDHVTLFDDKSGLDLGNVYAITGRGPHVWAAGEKGAAYWVSPTRFQNFRGKGHKAFASVSGIVETSNGDLWMNSADGVYRIAARELQLLKADPSYEPRFQLFTNDDGLNGTISLISGPTITQSTDGRIWVARTSNISWIDPNDIRHNSIAPVVVVDTLTSGAVTWHAGDVPALAPLTRELRIAYTAASLTQPERVHFQYQLDGVDEGWRDAGTRREAAYTNLSPGRYRFHVRAFNEDEVPSLRDATLEFSIKRAFYQTIWFKALMALLTLALLLQLFQWRLRVLGARNQLALEERLAERERIARDLHDTLLQGMHGIRLNMAALAKRNDLSADQRDVAVSIEERMRKVLLEGRDAISVLRQGDLRERDLASDLRAFGHEAVAACSTEFSLQVNGEPAALRPSVANEVFAIAREAISNASLHAHAQRIDVVIKFAKDFEVSVQDDGTGIDQAQLQKGRQQGHWGIAGMRERAAKLGGRLTIDPALPRGTNVRVRIPPRSAYATAFEPRRSLLRRLLRANRP